ncbi:MAG: hypothetical protein ABIA74_04570 [bacterium]
MKSIKKIFSLFLLIPVYLNTSTKTFFMQRPIQQDAVMQNAMNLEFLSSAAMQYKKDSTTNCGFILSGNVFYEESTNSSDITKYFFPTDKTELVVAGNTSGIARDDIDIAAEWLNIKNWDQDDLKTDYNSKISIDPKFKMFGVNLQIHKGLKFFSKNFWLTIILPFLQKETDLNLQEYDIKNPPTLPPLNVPRVRTTGALDFFQTSYLKYSKIKNGVNKLAGLADINLKLSYFFRNKKSWALAFYPQLTIPTGYKPTAVNLFEPIIGNGKHWALGAGINWQSEIFDEDNSVLSILLNIDYNYLFENTQPRTFDLKENGPWSRYTRITDIDNTTINSTPANLLTQNLKVTPESVVNLLLALHFSKNDFVNIEFGYNFWWKDKEKIKLKNEWIENMALLKINGNGVSTNQTISKTTIATDPVNEQADTTKTPIKFEDLNFDSVTHPSTLSNKIYLSLGIEGNWKFNIFQTNLGASYEFGDTKALSSWGIWLQGNLYI